MCHFGAIIGAAMRATGLNDIATAAAWLGTATIVSPVSTDTWYGIITGGAMRKTCRPRLTLRTGVW